MSQVVIGDILPYTQATATGGQTVFMTNWTANVASDVVVYKTPAATPPNDVTQILPYPAGYSIAFIGASQEVQVTLTVGAVAGDIITITRQTPADRMNLYSNTNFTPSMLNNDFGILTLVDQQAQLADQKIGPRYNYSAIIVDVVDTILPILEVNESWRKNSSGTGIEAFIALSGSEVGDIKFIVQQPNSMVPAAQALSALSTGILKSTTTTGVLSISAPISSLDSIGIGADQMAYGSGANTYSLTTLTPFSRTLLDDADAATWRATLGVGASGDFFAIANNLSEGVPSTMRTNLGLVIGTNVQAWDATLQSLSALGTTSDRIAYTTGVDTWAETTLTSFMRSVLGDANAADAAATLEVLPLAGGTMTGDLFLNADPTVGSQAATKAYVDAVAQNIQLACLCMTDADMPTWTYNNGVAGVGATLTAPSNGASTFDGIVPTNGQRVFVNLQTTNPAWQGPYTIVQGTLGTPTVLTRGTDYDQASEMQAGDIFSVVQGTTWAASQWMMSQVNAITVGTTAITFSQLVGQGALLKANNLSDLTNVATARINLGLVIGTNVQAWDATLQSISGLGTAADKMIYTTGVDTWAETDATAFGRSALGLSPSNGGIVYSTASNAAVLAGTATARQMLQSGSTAAPAWSTTTWPATSTVNQILFSSATSVIGEIATVNGGVLVANNLGVPSMLTNPAADRRILMSANAAIPIWSTAQYPSTAGTVNNVMTSDGTNFLSTTLTALIDAAFGSAQGDILYRNATVWTVLAPGTAGYLLQTGGAAANPSWVIPTVSNKLVNFAYTQTGAVASGTTLWTNSGDTIPTTSDGDQYLTITYTPSNASNILVLEIQADFTSSRAGADDIQGAIFQDANTNALSTACMMSVAANQAGTYTQRYIMVAGTASSTTFNFRAGSANVTSGITMNGQGGARKGGGVMATTWTITEYTP